VICVETFRSFDGEWNYAGITHIADNHEVVRRHPEKWSADGRPRRTGLARSRSAAAPSWRLPNPGERLGIDVSDPDVQSTARHEAGHAAAAFLIGWEPTHVELHPDGGGRCAFTAPSGLDPEVRYRQHAVICLAGRVHEGWKADDGDRKDRRNAWDALRTLVSDDRQVRTLMEAARLDAKQLAATAKFHWIARSVEEALLEHGRLDATALGPLLRSARLEYARVA
jgi:hypothetical protein